MALYSAGHLGVVKPNLDWVGSRVTRHGKMPVLIHLFIKQARAPVTPQANLYFLNPRDSLRNGVSSNGFKPNLRIDRPLDAAFQFKRQVANDLCEAWQPAAVGF